MLAFSPLPGWGTYGKGVAVAGLMGSGVSVGLGLTGFSSLAPR